MFLVIQQMVLLATNAFFKSLNEGGPLFMYTNLPVLIAVIVFLILAFIKKDEYQKWIQLIKHFSLFALVWGFLGQIIGLVEAFDTIEAMGDVSTSMLAGGLKVALLSPLFGMVIFLIARIGLIVLTFIGKNKSQA